MVKGACSDGAVDVAFVCDLSLTHFAHHMVYYGGLRVLTVSLGVCLKLLFFYS